MVLDGLVPSAKNAPVVGLALLKEGTNTAMYAYRVLQPNPGLYRSQDNGKTWKPFGTGTNGLILQLEIAPNNAQIFYAINKSNAVFPSQNGGKTWKQLNRSKS